MKLAAAAFLLAAAPLLSADAAGMDGWYGGLELGVAMSPKLTIKGLDNDFADSKKCDGFPVVALGRDNPDSAPDSPECATDRGNDWASTFDGGTGVLSGLVLGYHFKDFRIEGEYFYRTAGHDQETVPSIGGKIYGEEQDIIPYNKLGDIHSHNIFVNAYYDIPIEAKLRPYVGAGAGWSRVNLDYAARFTRISNGTTTVAIETFSNGVFGYQLIAGVDYPLGDRVTLGLKVPLG